MPCNDDTNNDNDNDDSDNDGDNDSSEDIIDHRIYHTIFKAVVKLKPERISSLNGIRTNGLCGASAVLYQLSYQANLGVGHFVSS